MPVLAALIVSVDAFFIGLSLGLNKKCKFMYLAVINVFLLILCLLGFFTAARVYELIRIDADLIVGLSFITLGAWCIFQYFLCRKKELQVKGMKTIILVGLIMSVEAKLITMGITFIFHPYSTIIIPLTVAVAHFGYSALTFYFTRFRYVRRVPQVIGHVVSGGALIVYGLLALL